MKSAASILDFLHEKLRFEPLKTEISQNPAAQNGPKLIIAAGRSLESGSEPQMHSVDTMRSQSDQTGN